MRPALPAPDREAAITRPLLTIDLDGPPCQGTCPGRGHLEALASGTYADHLAQARARENPEGDLGRAAASGQKVDARLAVELAAGGPGDAREVLDHVGKHLGVGIASFVNIFNPEIVIMGGVLRWVFPLVTDDVLDALDSWALRAPAEQAQIVLPWLGGDSVILGASELAFNDLLHDPVEVLSARPTTLPAGHA